MLRNKRGALLQGNAPFFQNRYVFVMILWMILLLMLLWLGRPVSAFVVEDVTDGRTVIVYELDGDLSLSHRYIHSVEKCPIIEIFVVHPEGHLELTESWNCSFGAGIAYDEGTGEGSVKDGYYVIEKIGKTIPELYMSPADFSEHTLTIGKETIALSEQYPYHTLHLTVEEMSRWKLWLKESCR